MEGKRLSDLISQDYLDIKDHAAVFGDRTSILVSARGEIDWGCFPYVDSEPVFFSILDKDRGGRFSIHPKVDGIRASQRYRNGTSTLITEFKKDGKLILTITDFLPTDKEPGVYFSEIHRIVKANANVKVDIVFEPFDGSEEKSFSSNERGYRVKHKGRIEYLATDIPLNRSRHGFRGEFTFKKGEERMLVAEYGMWDIYSLNAYETKLRLRATDSFWKFWLSDFKYAGIYPEQVKRSVITLKGMFFRPTGLMSAAPTSSLPEKIGGVRQWDYRYMWLRDTTYVLDTLIKLGFRREASKFLYSVINKVKHEGRIKTIYSVSGRKMVPETVCDLDGYRESKPVRFGNAASKQFQIDQYAALIIAVHSYMTYGGSVNLHMLETLKTVSRKIMGMWNRVDNSIWEIRGRERHYVYSKVLAWRALKDMVKISKGLGLAGPFEEKALKTADEIRASIERYGVSKGGFYTQYYGSRGVDASLLRLPLIGYCSPDSEVFKETLRQIEKRLMKEDFLFIRYDGQDGMGADNAFLLMSFWYIEVLTMMKRMDRAKKGLEKLIGMMNDVGLLPEEMDFDTHDYLGNYPQALSHLGLVLAILRYDGARKHA
jgi:glucoamylase